MMVSWSHLPLMFSKKNVYYYLCTITSFPHVWLVKNMFVKSKHVLNTLHIQAQENDFLLANSSFSCYETSHMVPSSNNYLMPCSKRESTMNTSLTRERLYINSLENHLIQAKILKGQNGYLLWAQQKDSMLGR